MSSSAPAVVIDDDDDEEFEKMAEQGLMEIKVAERSRRAFFPRLKGKGPPPTPTHTNYFEACDRLNRFLPIDTTKFITHEFDDDLESFGGRIVKVDPEDPGVIAAAEAAIEEYNFYESYSISSILKANKESLRPETNGDYFYITLILKDSDGPEATYQIKVFYGCTHQVKEFRLAPSDTKVNSSVTTTLPAASSVKRDTEELDLDNKIQKLNVVAGRMVDEVQPIGIAA